MTIAAMETRSSLVCFMLPSDTVQSGVLECPAPGEGRQKVAVGCSHRAAESGERAGILWVSRLWSAEAEGHVWFG